MSWTGVLLVLCCATLSCARPNGAPLSACASLTPIHPGYRPLRTLSPYTVSAEQLGDKVRVTISSPNDEDFQGFALQARSNGNRNEIVEGKFIVQNEDSKTIDCFSGKENTLTQTGTKHKREIVTEWIPSAGVNEDVVFRATVAKSFAQFWVDLDSPVLKIISESTSSPGKSPQGQSSLAQYEGCFGSKGCFGLPSGCITSTNCDVLLSYGNTMNGIRFTLSGSLGVSEYMAMGLSMDQSMGDDSVTECFRDNEKVVVRESWNNGKTNERSTEMPANSYEGVYRDGNAMCTWVAKANKAAVNGRIFNLGSANYYVLLAKGPMRGERLSYHQSRIASGAPVNFTAFEIIDGEAVPDSIKIHGTFMVTAWVGLVSIAILLARHFKTTWDSTRICGVQVWFAFHRALMITALLLIVIAFIVIFVHKNGWNYETSNPHAILGCITTALALIQPIMAAFRPDRNDSKRPIFNYLHWAVGNIAHILAVVTIFFATSLEASGLKESFYWAMAIYVIVHLIFHFLFQLHSMTVGKKKEHDVKMLEMSSNKSAQRDNGDTNLQDKSPRENVFQVLLLGVYFIFLIVIILALWSLIGVA